MAVSEESGVISEINGWLLKYLASAMSAISVKEIEENVSEMSKSGESGIIINAAAARLALRKQKAA
jgi:hypothetical protein